MKSLLTTPLFFPLISTSACDSPFFRISPRLFAAKAIALSQAIASHFPSPRFPTLRRGCLIRSGL